MTERRYVISFSVLALAVAVMLTVSVVTYLDQQDTNRNVIALANQHHADSDQIAAAQQSEILRVNRLEATAKRQACVRSNQTREGLRTFFQDSVTRSVARARIDRGKIRKIDLEGAASSRRSAHAERPDRC